MVEFVLISVLLVMLLFAVLQVAVLFYARNVIAASAADGARYAAASNMAPAAGGTRAEAEISQGLTARLSQGVPCAGTISLDEQSGLTTTMVRCTGRIRSIFLPFGAFVRIDVTARALTEPSS